MYQLMDQKGYNFENFVTFSLKVYIFSNKYIRNEPSKYAKVFMKSFPTFTIESYLFRLSKGPGHQENAFLETRKVMEKVPLQSTFSQKNDNFIEKQLPTFLTNTL